MNTLSGSIKGIKEDTFKFILYIGKYFNSLKGFNLYVIDKLEVH